MKNVIEEISTTLCIIALMLFLTVNTVAATTGRQLGTSNFGQMKLLLSRHEGSFAKEIERA